MNFILSIGVFLIVLETYFNFSFILKQINCWLFSLLWHCNVLCQKWMYLDFGLSLWSKLLRGRGTRPRNSSTPRKFLWRTVRRISAVFPFEGIALELLVDLNNSQVLNLFDDSQFALFHPFYRLCCLLHHTCLEFFFAQSNGDKWVIWTMLSLDF